MKFLLLIVVIGIALWLFKARGRTPGKPPAGKAPKPTRSAAPDKPKPKPEPTTMLACAHCGVHLPQADTLPDAAGRPFCTEAHRLAGPR